MDNNLIWRYFPQEFDGIPIMARQSMLTGEIQLRVDDCLAKANGYAGLSDLENRMRIYYGIPNLLLPEWMTVSNEIDFQMKFN